MPKPYSGLSRAGVALPRVIALLLAVAAPHVATADDAAFQAKLAGVIEAPKYKQAHWGVLVVDLATGKPLLERNRDKLFAPASVTKLFTVANALDAFGPDHRFETPVFLRGQVAGEGVLTGDLILVAGGDLTLGGRTTPEGTIAFANTDHTYAEFLDSAEWTTPDPLAGLDDLARQIAGAGVRKIKGDVLIDARLFETARGTGSGPSQVTPIVVNDNVVDVRITPRSVGNEAKIAWRPHTSAYKVTGEVTTVAAGQPTKVSVSLARPGEIVVMGQIAVDRKPLCRMVPVSHPETFARALFVEALQRAHVTIDTPAGPEPAAALPLIEEYARLKRVATLQSPPFREEARLILKVSHNLHASSLPILAAVKRGEGRTLAIGLKGQGAFLRKAGLEVDSISFGGGAGGDRADYVTPAATVALLRYMSTRPDFTSYEQALPRLGVDGTLASSVGPQSPARDKVAAKTGTLVWTNVMNERGLLTSKALAGYATAKSGRQLAFALFVNNVHVTDSAGAVGVGNDLGRICELFWEEW